jgi:hypothetical protein
MKIENWGDVPDGARVIEDTYNEVYTIFTRRGQKWLRQTGWCGGRNNPPIPENSERFIDFEPNAFMDQPWYRID